MNDAFRIYGVNGGVLAAVSMLDVESTLKVVALALTCIWTAMKIYSLARGRNNTEED